MECKRKTKAKETKSDKEDDDFVGSSSHSDSTSDGGESDLVEITLKEVSDSQQFILHQLKRQFQACG